MDSNAPVADLHSHIYVTFLHSCNMKRQRHLFGSHSFLLLSLVELRGLAELTEIITCPEAVVNSQASESHHNVVALLASGNLQNVSGAVTDL